MAKSKVKSKVKAKHSKSRKIVEVSTSDMTSRIMRCACGEKVTVIGDDVVSVKCCYCSSNSVPVRTAKQFEELMRVEETRIKEEAKVVKVRGRPKMTDEEKKQKQEEKRKKVLESKKHVELIRSKGKIKQKKGKSMNTSEGSNAVVGNAVKGKETRGRKATVGHAVLDYIQKSGKANFGDVYSVYSSKLKEIGKGVDEDRQKANLYSTLYILKRNGKIKEIEKRSVYGSIIE